MRLRFLLLLLAAALPAQAVWADGTITHLSGSVSVRKADGSVQAAKVGAKVAVGETLVTGAGGYVRMEMTDGGEMVLRPDSQLRVESYKFAEAKPAEDSFLFSMLKGGMRTVTGLIGKRGNRDAYQLNTPTATIGIRGTQFDARVCQGDCGALANGTYVAVRSGAIFTSNSFGGIGVAAGGVAHVPPAAPPVMLPRDPGIGFTPPPAIPKLDEKKKSQGSAAGGGSGDGGGQGPNKPGPQSPRPQATGPAADAQGADCTVE